jgi:hypothetical protein
MTITGKIEIIIDLMDNIIFEPIIIDYIYRQIIETACHAGT